MMASVAEAAQSSIDPHLDQDVDEKQHLVIWVTGQKRSSNYAGRQPTSSETIPGVAV